MRSFRKFENNSFDSDDSLEMFNFRKREFRGLTLLRKKISEEKEQKITVIPCENQEKLKAYQALQKVQ